MVRNEIKKFSTIEPYCFETKGEETWLQIGCIDVLEAVDEELDVTTHRWYWYIVKYSIKKWAYVDKIIPNI